jgi:hypothetical protein
MDFLSTRISRRRLGQVLFTAAALALSGCGASGPGVVDPKKDGGPAVTTAKAEGGAAGKGNPLRPSKARPPSAKGVQPTGSQ